MTNNRMTFGEHIKQFALSADYLESGHYEQVQQHVMKYLGIQLAATQVAFFESALVDNRDGISTVWSYPKFRVHQTLREEDEPHNYRRQLALAIGEQRNLWVISQTGEPLGFRNHGVDVWGDTEDDNLPPFFAATKAQASQTAVVIISRNSQGRPNGAFLTEIDRPVRPSKILKREMQLIADALGLMHATDFATHEKHYGTQRAIANLGDLVGKLDLDTGPRPLLFVASSSRASEDVIKAIEEVLELFRDHVFVQPWYKMHQPGNINMQLVDEIRSAQFGICYLSEDTKDDEYRFSYNRNVLVEAGMLHIVTAGVTKSGTGWIPIREKDSRRMPFDLENQRTVQIERDDNGDMNVGSFKEDLIAKIGSLLEIKQLPMATMDDVVATSDAA